MTVPAVDIIFVEHGFYAALPIVETRSCGGTCTRWGCQTISILTIPTDTLQMEVTKAY